MDGKVDRRVSHSDSDDEIFHPGCTYTPRWCTMDSSMHFTSCGSLSSDGADGDVGDGGKHGCRFQRQHSIVDGLLFEIYDRWHGGSLRDSFDSDTLTECSSTSEVFYRHSFGSVGRRHSISRQFQRAFFENQSVVQLKRMVSDLQRSIGQSSHRLVRQLKRRDRRIAKLHRNCDVVTAILQAVSLKRRIDTRMRFSIEPPTCMGESAFDQWKDAMRAVARLPMGIPTEFRKKVWLSLADNHISELKVDWEKTVRFTFNERSNPDDDKLGLQIVKDLHRTGCTNFSGHDNDEERAVLKRVLLAYARWNKHVGYCQGFNVIAALLLDVMNRKEDDALKVMIYLIDHVLPDSYFTNNLRALSVDMAVFRDLLELALPTLAHHLHRLQHAAQDVATGACYEPPLTNVFTMQWFLTLFATCLPKNIVLRVWDSIFLEGSEVLLRTALTIWGKLSKRILGVSSADEFYTLMGDLSAEMMDGCMFNGDYVIKSIYSLSPFPFPQIKELREKYTYNIRPFTNTASSAKKPSRASKNILYSDEDDLDDEDIEAITCFPGFTPLQVKKGGDSDGGSGSVADISVLGPGVYGSTSDNLGSGQSAVYMERMSTDITALQKQYEKLRQRQTQAHIIISAATARSMTKRPKPTALVPKIESPLAMNHLFVGKNSMGSRNRLIAEGPRIVSMFPRNTHFTKHLQALDRASAKLTKEKDNNSKSSVKKSNTSVNTSQAVEMEKRKSEDTAGSKEVESGQSQDNVGSTKSQDNVGSTQSQDNVGSTQSQDTSASGKVQDGVGSTKLQDNLRSSESQDNLRSSESQDNLRSSESQDKLRSCQSEDNLRSSQLQDNLRSTQSQDNLRSGESQDNLRSGESQDNLKSSEPQDNLRSGESQDTVGTKESQENVESRERKSSADVKYQGVQENGLQMYASLHMATMVTSVQSKNTDSVLVGTVDRSDLCGNNVCSQDRAGCELNTVEHKSQYSAVSRLDLCSSSNSSYNEDSTSGCSAVLDKNNSTLLTGSVEKLPSLEESDSAMLNSHVGISEEIPRQEHIMVKSLCQSNICTDISMRTSSESDCGPSPRWTTITSADASQTESHMVTKFVYIASKQYNNRNTSSSSSASSAATSPTTPVMTSSPVKSNKPFFPFPVKHVNRNRAKNGLKLGLYNPSTVELGDSTRQKQGNGFVKTRNGLS
ncbi:TBC1 domain family member 30-like [Gigantopelta aegis]|uniref:TBC1 domain family member 30-like n=1 Tax=Gigantopelta aegis TaxID=1735272 RepID=UPI001B88E6F3|nr:TBC1 domain family member 30-like [Gigantopelta aegis]